MSKQIAFAREANKECSLFCEVESRQADGRIYFHVINGAWRGSFKDGILTCSTNDNDERTTFPVVLVWEGDLGNKGYNSAMYEIDKQRGLSSAKT